jgi:predicted glutamine amidotransferase
MPEITRSHHFLALNIRVLATVEYCECMCRMLGMAAARPTGVRDLLFDAPRSLRSLSEEHCDGWGIALYRETWTVHRSTLCAARCEVYATIDLNATLAIAHVRKKTVGELAIANTHPFRRGRFVFAHNGTVETARLVARTSAAQLSAIEGTTDSEKMFAFVLTQIDELGDTELGITAAVKLLHGFSNLGSATFLLGDGERLFAHRLGRTLFTASREGATIIASEPLGDRDPWSEVAERELLVLDAFTARVLAA